MRGYCSVPLMECMLVMAEVMADNWSPPLSKQLPTPLLYLCHLMHQIFRGGGGGDMPPDLSSGCFLHALPIANAWLRLWLWVGIGERRRERNACYVNDNKCGSIT